MDRGLQVAAGLLVLLFFFHLAGRDTRDEPLQAAEPRQSATAYPWVEGEDLQLLAQIIWLEARGEPFEGQVAVGAVVLNRVRSPHFPGTVAGVLAQPGQFGFGFEAIRRTRPNRTAYEAARRALLGEDPTGGALFFYNPEQTVNPDFWRNRPVVARIGNHVFTR